MDVRGLWIGILTGTALHALFYVRLVVWGVDWHKAATLADERIIADRAAMETSTIAGVSTVYDSDNDDFERLSINPQTFQSDNEEED